MVESGTALDIAIDLEVQSLLPGTAKELAALAISQLEHALDGRRRGLKVYESLKNVNDVIGTQYGDRVLFELVQNAHDAHTSDRSDSPGEIAVRLIVENDESGELLVANKGRPFTTSNLNAIRNIATSDKQIGEGIGNKGLGFRSVEALTDDVHIYSMAGSGGRSYFDGYCFRFATSFEIEQQLLDLGASIREAREVARSIPRYLVPISVDSQSDAVCELARNGFATVVSLPLTSADAISLAERQVKKLTDETVPVLLFLDRIEALDVAISRRDTQEVQTRLTRSVRPLSTSREISELSLSEITLNKIDLYLLVRRTLRREDLLEAVLSSIPAAPPLKRWLDWQGDAVISIAVALDSKVATAGRLFNFLPMDDGDRAASPIVGHVDAPFFADIDRRSIKPDLPLNRHLLDEAALTAAAAALAIVDHKLELPATTVVDLSAWASPHMQKIIAAFNTLQRPLAQAAIWPIAFRGERRWASIERLYAWPDVQTSQLTPARLAETAAACIFASGLGEARLTRVKALASTISLPLDLTEEVICRWIVAFAEYLSENRRRSTIRWSALYEDICKLFSATGARLSALEGCKLFPDKDGNLLRATAGSHTGSPPVFVRARQKLSPRRERLPTPPPSLARKFRFLDERIELSEDTQRAFEKAGLLRRYDPLEILSGIGGALGDKPTDLQRKEALIWSFKVWNILGKTADDSLRAATLYLPTLGGWHRATKTLFSASWTSLGRILEPYLIEAASVSHDCKQERDRLLVSFTDWPRSASDDRREDWFRFLTVLEAKDGLQPIAPEVRRNGTPSVYWHPLFSTGNVGLGLDNIWLEQARDKRLKHPHTDYRLDGELWRFPGQLEHQTTLSDTAKENLSDLIVAFLRLNGDRHFSFSVEHGRGWDKAVFATPAATFLAFGAWMVSLKRDEIVLAAPRASWSTTLPRQIPPRFIARFAAEPGNRSSVPPILFDARIGLRDWSKPDTAPQRLASLAAALDDLSAAERRDLRSQLRRAWYDTADGKFSLDKKLPLVVEKASGLETCTPDPNRRPIVHVTSERQGFAARALVDRNEAVLDVGGETDTTAIRGLLEATGGFSVKTADTGDVRLLVDGEDFQPESRDPFLIAGSLSWLVDAAVLAHEYLGDPLEARSLPVDELDRRFRQIRIRRCQRFALIIADQEVEAREERLLPVTNARAPTLLVATTDAIGLEFLLRAAPALTKLVESRRNTLEMMLGRLSRDGFADARTPPTIEQYARAVGRDVEIVREHFEATSGGIERRVNALIPVVAHLVGFDRAAEFSAQRERSVTRFDLRERLAHFLDDELAELCLAAVKDTEDQRLIRQAMGFELSAYAQTLAALGYPPLNDEEEFRRLFQVYLAEMRPAVIDRLRRHFLSTWEAGGDLSSYSAKRSLDFVTFDTNWILTQETLVREAVANRVAEAVEATLGPDDLTIKLEPLDFVVAANRKLIIGRHPRIASLVRAWCRKRNVSRPSLMEATDPQVLFRSLDSAGLLDFEPFKPEALPKTYKRVGAWPAKMPSTFDLTELDLVTADLEHEVLEAREAKHQAEIARNTIEFAGTKIDTGDEAFPRAFENIAESSISNGDGWLNRSRSPRLQVQESRSDGFPRGGARGKGQSWRNQPPEKIRNAMGLASEWLVREYLRRRFPEMDDECWMSSNRAAFCSGDEGSDNLGYDFRVETERNEWLFEVKSALDAGGEFEMSAREIEVAGSASLDNKRRYRILYVPFVFEPAKWCVLQLMNPVAESARNHFRVVRSGSVRYRFDVR